MKQQVLIGLLLLQANYLPIANAADTPDIAAEIPTLEKDFVNAVHDLNKAKLIAQFGEPEKADDVRIKGSNKIAASIWQYHFINTSADGSYYETTELDFIDDKVVQVVFINNDGSEGTDHSQKYEVP